VQFPLVHWLLRLHFLPLGLRGALAEAMLGAEASVPPRRAAPINLSDLPRETLPLAIPLARASKELSRFLIHRVHPFRTVPNHMMRFISILTFL